MCWPSCVRATAPPRGRRRARKAVNERPVDVVQPLTGLPPTRTTATARAAGINGDAAIAAAARSRQLARGAEAVQTPRPEVVAKRAEGAVEVAHACGITAREALAVASATPAECTAQVLTYACREDTPCAGRREPRGHLAISVYQMITRSGAAPGVHDFTGGPSTKDSAERHHMDQSTCRAFDAQPSAASRAPRGARRRSAMSWASWQPRPQDTGNHVERQAAQAGLVNQQAAARARAARVVGMSASTPSARVEHLACRSLVRSRRRRGAFCASARAQFARAMDVIARERAASGTSRSHARDRVVAQLECAECATSRRRSRSRWTKCATVPRTPSAVSEADAMRDGGFFGTAEEAADRSSRRTNERRTRDPWRLNKTGVPAGAIAHRRH